MRDKRANYGVCKANFVQQVKNSSTKSTKSTLGIKNGSRHYFTHTSQIQPRSLHHTFFTPSTTPYNYLRT